MNGVLTRVVFMGWDLAQWAGLLGILLGAFLAAALVTRPIAALVRTRGTDSSSRLAQNYGILTGFASEGIGLAAPSSRTELTIDERDAPQAHALHEKGVT